MFSQFGLEASVSASTQSSTLGQIRTVEFLLDVATAIFCLVLICLTLYAWNRRDRPLSLLIFSTGFLVFFLRQVIEFFPSPLDPIELQFARSFFDFLTLALFFAGLVLIGHRRKPKLNDLR